MGGRPNKSSSAEIRFVSRSHIAPTPCVFALEGTRRLESSDIWAFVRPRFFDARWRHSPSRRSSCRQSPRGGCFLRQRMNRAARCLKTGLVRLPVHQPLAFNAADRGEGAVDVAVAERDAVIVTVVE